MVAEAANAPREDITEEAVLQGVGEAHSSGEAG